MDIRRFQQQIERIVGLAGLARRHRHVDAQFVAVAEPRVMHHLIWVQTAVSSIGGDPVERGFEKTIVNTLMEVVRQHSLRDVGQVSRRRHGVERELPSVGPLHAQRAQCGGAEGIALEFDARVGISLAHDRADPAQGVVRPLARVGDEHGALLGGAVQERGLGVESGT